MKTDLMKRLDEKLIRLARENKERLQRAATGEPYFKRINSKVIKRSKKAA